jgi:Fe-S oxidoreductase
VVTCGTCREGLGGMNTQDLFGRIVDVAAYLAESGLKLDGADEALYHAPCHDSLEGKAAQVLAQIGGFGDITAVPHCCSEAGTLSLSRPDITHAMLLRKRESLAEAGAGKGAVVLTNCPSCLQGLGRSRALIAPKHIAIALAERHSGQDWKRSFLAEARNAVAIRL